MLSRREKLLVQPWQDRRYQDHRAKVSRSRPAVDCSRPAPRPHVRVKADLRRREDERATRLLDDNYRLLQRLAHIMTRNRLDNRWDKPLPNFHRKVGRFSAAACRAPSPSPDLPPVSVKCYACEFRKMRTRHLNVKAIPLSSVVRHGAVTTKTKFKHHKSPEPPTSRHHDDTTHDTTRRSGVYIYRGTSRGRAVDACVCRVSCV
ncbi:unnamed protein product [Danaus chrysippus]|uniref:(African queen) hypothetical protein n=1 Tax=Danaus chrysippus TaxID=151541 RepID=A0A8J2QNK5_9NEOP|nr:unnamed protein product [Danaus chrysippus]